MDPQLTTQAGEAIRRRPSILPNRKYERCMKTVPCEDGSSCTFAHSKEELHHWFQSRVEEEPRLHPTKGARPPYQMCNVAESNGYCPHDVHCNFAHSKKEIEAWKSTIQEREEESIRPRPEIHPLAHYDICKNAAPCPNGLKCTFAHSEKELHVWFQTRVKEEPRKQPPKGAWPPFQKCKNVEDTGYCSFDVHCNFWHSEEELKAWERYVQEGEEVPIRPRPEINPLVSYEMCKNKESCLYGQDCTFAHSEEELCHWIQSRVKDKPRQDPPAMVEPDNRMCKNVEERGYCPSDVHCHCPHSKDELDAWLARRPPASVHDDVQTGLQQKHQQPELQSAAHSLEATDWQLAYKESLDNHASVEVDVKRCIFVGMPSVGKSSLKHLLVHNAPKAVKKSTAVMEAPEVVTERYAVGFTSEWQPVTDDVMEKSVQECIAMKDYDAEHTYPEEQQAVEEEAADVHTSEMSVASADSQALECMSTKNEVVALLEKHRPILPRRQGKSIPLQHSSFIHLLDTGGQPSFQDALPLLLNAPCTYIQVFNASRDLDQPVPITYRPNDEEEVEEDQQLSSETAWDMMLRSFSSMQTMAHKCSKKMPIFQRKGSHPPKLCIFVVGSFRDQLIKEGREKKAVEDICKRLKKLEGKPYYHSIQANSAGQLFYFINSMAENEDDRADVKSLREDISKVEYSLQLKVPVMWFECMQTTQRCPQKFLRFQDLQEFCSKCGFVEGENAEKQFSALLHLFSLLGFYSFFNLRGVPNESNFVCTDTGVFLKEVSKLLAIQHHKQPRCSGVRKFQQYGIISSDDDELFEELGIRKEVDRKWFLGALEHLGLLARYSDSGHYAPSYFMPIALPQEKMKMDDQGIVASLCVTFKFPATTPPLVDTDLPRGIFCQLAVELIRSWEPIPKASNRNTVKFRWGKFNLYLREAPGFISLTPFLIEELDGKDPIQLHKLCREMHAIFSKGLESAAEDVLGVQGRQAANLVFGFECCCDCTQTPHLATLRQAASKGESLICPAPKGGRDSKQEEQIWFSPVYSKLVKLHNKWIIDSFSFVTVGATVGAETDEHEYKQLIVPGSKNKPSQQCTDLKIRDVLDIVAHHKKEINAMLNHPAGGTVHFGIKDKGNIVEEGLNIDQDTAMDDLQARVGQIMENFFPAVGTSFWSVKPVNLLDNNEKETGQWIFDICVKPHAHRIVWLKRDKPEAFYRQGACSHPMPADMLEERIKATVTGSSSVNASPVVKDVL